MRRRRGGRRAKRDTRKVSRVNSKKSPAIKINTKLPVVKKAPLTKFTSGSKSLLQKRKRLRAPVLHILRKTLHKDLKQRAALASHALRTQERQLHTDLKKIKRAAKRNSWRKGCVKRPDSQNAAKKRWEYAKTGTGPPQPFPAQFRWC